MCCGRGLYVSRPAITHLVENSLFEIATGIYLLVLAVLAIRNYLRPEKLTPMAIKMTAAIVVATVLLFSDVIGENLGMTLLDGLAAHFAIAAMFLTSSLYVGWRVIKLPVDLIGATRAAQPAPNSKQNTTGDRFYDPL